VTTGTEPIQALTNVARVQLNVTDHAMIVEIR
jgi:hypothetical protein